MKKLNLMTAVGSSIVDPLTDPQMDYEPPALGNKHYPTSHAEAFESLMQATEICQLRIVQQKSAIDKSGARFFTIMELESPYSDYSDLFAARWSYDQKVARTASGGDGTWICDNLCINGIIVVNLKHTKFMSSKITNAYCAGIRAVLEANKKQANILGKFRTTGLSDKMADHLMMEMLRRGIITTNNIKRVSEEWQEPKHADHAENGQSIFRLYSAVTEAAFKPAKTSAQEVLFKRGPMLRNLLESYVTDQE